MKRQEESVFSLTPNATSQLVKFGLALLGVFCLMAGPAGAQESEPLETASSGMGYSVSEWNPLTFADNPVSSFRGTGQGTDNVSGSYTCSAAGTSRYLGPGEPPAADVEGVCDPASAFIWSYGSYDYSLAECRLENTGQIFTFDLPGTVVSCVPFSCFGDPLITEEGAELYLPKVGCTFSAFYTQTGMSEDGTSTIETVEKLTYEQVECGTRTAVWSWLGRGAQRQEWERSPSTQKQSCLPAMLLSKYLLRARR